MNLPVSIYDIKRISRNLFSFLLISATLFTFYSCVDDDLTLDENQGGLIDDMDGDVLAFAIKLDKDITSRAMFQTQYDESLENYIDTQNKFRVLFFDKDGYFMFGAIDRTVTPIGDNYYVRIPFNYIVDRSGKAYDVDVIKNKLKTEKFKIAVLANWPNNGVINPSDYDDSEDGLDRPVIEPTTIKGEPNWGWENSCLNPSNQGNGDKTNLRHISDLHHLIVDGNYNNKSDNFGQANKRFDRIEVYDFVMDGDVANGQGTMGVKVDWVRMRDISEGWKLSDTPQGTFNTTETASTWIKANWDPSLSLNPSSGEGKIYRHYNNIWKLWDFESSYNYKYLNTNTYKESKWGEKWYNRNGDDLATWLYGDNEDYFTALPEFSFEHSSTTSSANEADFKFTPGVVEATGFWDKTTKALGISLPMNGGEFSFKAHASGTVRIKFSSATDGNEARLYIQKGKEGDDGGESHTTKSTSQVKADYCTWQTNLTGKSQDITIRCDRGTAVIYSIEFVRDKYLYDTDREGILPSEDFPIPMYGVQDFDPATDWADGTTKDISLEGKSISLIRSLAKVVVYLPEEATHIYMRTSNRTARCEPIDVETPTDKLWKDHSKTGGCEWFNIIDHGHGFDLNGNDENNKNGIDDYYDFLSWFYGAWRWDAEGNKKTNWIWDFDTHDKYYATGKINTKVDGESDKTKFPRLYYPDINRSDYAAFRYVGKVNGLHKYVLYAPEKNIVDPNNVGKVGSVAKIAHVEFRYNGQGENSLDDNDCHRIYFTNYGGDENVYGSLNPYITSVAADKYEPVYEKNQYEEIGDDGTTTKVHRDNLSYHWPIMRNHVYEFQVSGDGSVNLGVQLKVRDWGYEKVHAEW